MPRFVGVTMQKGGVGKTLIAKEIAAALANKGHKVLFADLDPAGHGTKAFRWSVDLEIQARQAQGLSVPRELQHLHTLEQEETALAAEEGREPELQELYTLDGPNLFQALIPEAFPPRKGKSRPAITVQQLIRILPGEKFHLLPAHEEMTALQQWLSNASNRIERLWNFFLSLDDDYIVVLDSPPDLGPITDSVLFVSRSSDSHALAVPGNAGILVPMEADDESLNALDQLWAQIETLERVATIHLDILAVVVNKFEDGILGNEILRDIRANLPQEIVAQFAIRKRNVARKAYRAGQSIYTYWPSDHREKHLQKDVLDLRKWFDQLADLVLARLHSLSGLEAENEQVEA